MSAESQRQVLVHCFAPPALELYMKPPSRIHQSCASPTTRLNVTSWKVSAPFVCSYDPQQETEEGERVFGHRGHTELWLLEDLQLFCLLPAELQGSVSRAGDLGLGLFSV